MEPNHIRANLSFRRLDKMNTKCDILEHEYCFCVIKLLRNEEHALVDNGNSFVKMKSASNYAFDKLRALG